MAHIPMSVNNFESRPPGDETVPHYEGVDLSAVRGALFDGEAVDRVFHGSPPGIQMLTVTNQRLLMVERVIWDERMAMTSVPFGRVTAVSMLSDQEHKLDRGVVVGIKVQTLGFELHLGSTHEAWEAHDLITWSLLH